MNIDLLDEISAIELQDEPLSENEKMRVMANVRKRLPKKKNKLFVIPKAIGVLAACYALLIGVSVVNPVFADTFPIVKKLPFAEKIIYSLNHSEGYSYQSPVIRSGAVEKYLNSVSQLGDSDFSILESYCDGTALILSAAIKVDGADPAVKVLQPVYKIRINGAPVTVETANGSYDETGSYFERMTRVDDSVFVGTIVVDISNMELQDSLDLNIRVSSLAGIDNKHYVKSNIFSDSYTEKTYDIDAVPAEVNETIKVDSDLQKTYDVGETKDIVTLNGITASPSSTHVDFTLNEDDSDDPVLMLLYDSEGSQIPWLKFGFETQRTYYKPLLKDTDSLTVKFYRKSDKRQSIAEFTVPVEGGFADIYEAPVVPEDGSDTIYDPPVPDPSTGRPFGAQVSELGETVTVNNHSPGLSDGKLYVTYTNMQVYDSYTDAGVSYDELSGSGEERYGDEAYKFVTFDVNIKSENTSYHNDQGDTPDAVQGIYDKEAREYGKFDETSSTYWISSFFRPCLINESLVTMDDCVSGEVDYFSDAMHGFSNYYHFIMNSNDERDFTVGVFVPKTQLENGNFQIAVEKEPGINSYSYINIPATTK